MMLGLLERRPYVPLVEADLDESIDEKVLELLDAALLCSQKLPRPKRGLERRLEVDKKLLGHESILLTLHHD